MLITVNIPMSRLDDYFGGATNKNVGYQDACSELLLRKCTPVYHSRDYDVTPSSLTQIALFGT